MSLNHADCKRLVLDQDLAFPSKAAYLARTGADEELWWSLHYLHDRLKDKGERRTSFYKWVTFFKASIQASGLVDEDAFFVHCKGVNTPASQLDDTVATSSGILAFFFRSVETSRTSSIVLFIQGQLREIVTRVTHGIREAMDLPDGEEVLPLHVSPGGAVSGLKAGLQMRHQTMLEAWAARWGLMHASGLLGSELEDTITLQDLVIFLATAERFRKHSGARAWTERSLRVLSSLQKSVVKFLATELTYYILMVYMAEHSVDKAFPSRGRALKAEGKARVTVAPDSIWELMQSADRSGVSLRQAVLLHENPLLSEAAGCREHTVDAWQRRHQILYDERVNYSLQGANHFNLVADGSTHSCKDILVSIVFSHENNSAAFPPVQMILPNGSSRVGPGEMELEDPVARLAQDSL